MTAPITTDAIPDDLRDTILTMWYGGDGDGVPTKRIANRLSLPLPLVRFVIRQDASTRPHPDYPGTDRRTTRRGPTMSYRRTVNPQCRCVGEELCAYHRSVLARSQRR